MPLSPSLDKLAGGDRRLPCTLVSRMGDCHSWYAWAFSGEVWSYLLQDFRCGPGWRARGRIDLLHFHSGRPPLGGFSRVSCVSMLFPERASVRADAVAPGTWDAATFRGEGSQLFSELGCARTPDGLQWRLAWA